MHMGEDRCRMKEGSRKGLMQEWRNVGNERGRKGGIWEERDSGKEGCRKGRIQGTKFLALDTLIEEHSFLQMSYPSV